MQPGGGGPTPVDESGLGEQERADAEGNDGDAGGGLPADRCDLGGEPGEPRVEVRTSRLAPPEAMMWLRGERTDTR
ncbi:hypothetical protein ACWC2T_33530 [Streptomyces sp. NPDC001393]